MESLPIVEDCQVLKNARSGLLNRLERVALDTFSFERGKETLHQGVVIGFPFPAHAQHDTLALEDASIAPAGVLAAAVGVMHQPCLGASTEQRHLECGLD